MRFGPSPKHDGRSADGDVYHGCFDIQIWEPCEDAKIVDANGKQIGTVSCDWSDWAKCQHRGDVVLETLECQSCNNKSRIKVYSCAVLGRCSILKDVGTNICTGCEQFSSAHS